MEKGTKVRIREGAVVFQDFGWERWPKLPHGYSGDIDQVFTVERSASEGKSWVSAYGYGMILSEEQYSDPVRAGMALYSYGNGSMAVKNDDLVIVDVAGVTV